MDVASWLRNLGLERYEAAFRENDVSAEDLRHLTAEDLDGLGVSAIGHRRRLLVAITALRSEGPSPGDPAGFRYAMLSSLTGNPGVPESTAERHPLSFASAYDDDRLSGCQVVLGTNRHGRARTTLVTKDHTGAWVVSRELMNRPLTGVNRKNTWHNVCVVDTLTRKRAHHNEDLCQYHCRSGCDVDVRS